MRKYLFKISLVLFLVIAFAGNLIGDVKVRGHHRRGYYRKDGTYVRPTYVRPHYRSDPDGDISNNWSTYPNINPYTGKQGTKYKYASPKSKSSYNYNNYKPYTYYDYYLYIIFLQIALKNLGYDPGPIDGILGPKTKYAILRFQNRNGLKIDGIAGPKTLGKIRVLLSRLNSK